MYLDHSGNCQISLKGTCVSVEWRFLLRPLPLHAFVTGVGNGKRATRKEKETIEANAVSQNVSCFETVSCVTLLLTCRKKSDSFKKCYVYDAVTPELG
jgi:hypothetical protein